MNMKNLSQKAKKNIFINDNFSYIRNNLVLNQPKKKLLFVVVFGC